MKFLTSAAMALALAVTANTASAACDDGEIVIKFSHVTNTDKHPKGIAATLLEQRVNDEMNGKACMEVFPNSTLYNDNQVLEAMLQGDVQMAAPSLSKFEQFTKTFRLFDLPFMFKNIDAVDDFQASDNGQALLDSMQRRGLQGLAYWHNGMKQISANIPLELPTDAEGLVFRIQPSAVLAAQVEALGAEGRAMPFSQVYDALESGEVDAQANTWSNIYTQGFYLVQDGITETNHGIIDYLVVTSNDWWQGLEPDLRADLEQILLEVTHERNRFAFELGELNRINVRRDGGVIRQLDEDARSAWVAALTPVWDQFRDEIGDDLIAAAQAAEGGI